MNLNNLTSVHLGPEDGLGLRRALTTARERVLALAPVARERVLVPRLWNHTPGEEMWDAGGG